MINTDGATTVAQRGSIIDRCDISISREGSLFLVYPITADGRDFLVDNVDDDAQWFGGALVVEQHYIYDLFDGMVDAGLRVE